MDCKIVRDLIPLYVDGCCSGESAKAVEEHIRDCADCKAELELMGQPVADTAPEPKPTEKLNRVSLWKASLLQSVIMFAAFGVIVFGVAMEAATAYVDPANGFWANAVVVPATGFMLSMANWYFVRLYPSRRSFAVFSCLITVLMIGCAFLWTVFHYDGIMPGILEPSIETAARLIPCVLSPVLAWLYAGMIGKE